MVFGIVSKHRFRASGVCVSCVFECLHRDRLLSAAARHRPHPRETEEAEHSGPGLLVKVDVFTAQKAFPLQTGHSIGRQFVDRYIERISLATLLRRCKLDPIPVDRYEPLGSIGNANGLVVHVSSIDDVSSRYNEMITSDLKETARSEEMNCGSVCDHNSHRGLPTIRWNMLGNSTVNFSLKSSCSQFVHSDAASFHYGTFLPIWA